MDKHSNIRLCAYILVGCGIGAVMGYFGKCATGTCPLTATPIRGAVYGAVMGALLAFSIGAQ
jgi:hypothetical protein